MSFVRYVFFKKILKPFSKFKLKKPGSAWLKTWNLKRKGNSPFSRWELVSSLIEEKSPYWKKKLSPGFEFVKKYKKTLICFFIGFVLSDLLIIRSYEFLLPPSDLPPLRLAVVTKPVSLESYKRLWDKNIFHEGAIPEEMETQEKISLDPVLSSLPLELKGTIIHANPKKSVATIKSLAGSKKGTESYSLGSVIEDQARIREILRGRVVFLNLSNNRVEYIIIPEKKKSLDIALKPEKKEEKKKVPQKSSLVKRQGNEFRVKRSRHQ